MSVQRTCLCFFLLCSCGVWIRRMCSASLLEEEDAATCTVALVVLPFWISVDLSEPMVDSTGTDSASRNVTASGRQANQTILGIPQSTRTYLWTTNHILERETVENQPILWRHSGHAVQTPQTDSKQPLLVYHNRIQHSNANTSYERNNCQLLLLLLKGIPALCLLLSHLVFLWKKRKANALTVQVKHQDKLSNKHPLDNRTPHSHAPRHPNRYTPLFHLRTALFVLLYSQPPRVVALEMAYTGRATMDDASMVLCTVDGTVTTLDAQTGLWRGDFRSGPPLIATFKLESEEKRIVPGLDGRLHVHQQDQPLQTLKVTIPEVMQTPVKTCSPEGCGILTGTKAVSLFALDVHGLLVWTQQYGESKRWAGDIGNIGPTVLLQREDYWVRQLSAETGDAIWNVTLGSFQALDFGEEPPLQREPHGMLPGRQQPEQDSPLHRAKHPLPVVAFGDNGKVLMAVDARDGRTVLWRRRLPTVLATVFGIHQGIWRQLDVLDTFVEQPRLSSTASWEQQQRHKDATRRNYERFLDGRRRNDWLWMQDDDDELEYKLLSDQTGLVVYHSPPEQWMRRHLEFARLREHAARITPTSTSYLSSFDQTGATEHFSNDFRVHQKTLPAGTGVPIPPPQGLFLPWAGVVAIVSLLITAPLVAYVLYLRTKQRWLVQNAPSVTRSNSNSPDDLSLHSQPLFSNKERTNIVRTMSLPAFQAQSSSSATPQIPTPAKITCDSLPFPSVIKTSPSTTRTGAQTQNAQPPEEKQQEEQFATEIMDGIPLVRYSRFKSEFRENRPLGKGGFGSVFQCANVLDGREYAVKKVSIRSDTHASGTLTKESSLRLQRVLREVKVLALLDHPNIVRYYTAWLEIQAEMDASHAAVDDSYLYNETGTDIHTRTLDPKLPRCYSSELITGTSEASLEKLVRRPSNSKMNPLGWKNNFCEEDFSETKDRSSFSLGSYGFTFQRSDSEDSSNDSNSKDESTLNKDAVASEAKNKDATTGATLTKNSKVALSRITEGTKTTKSPRIAAVSVRHTLYIQMQLCSHKNLGDFLNDEQARRGGAGPGQIDIPYALSLFLQVVEGVKHVHERGLIHRDLKPSNCFIDSGVVKVGDFGLSRESGDKEIGDDSSSSSDPTESRDTAHVGDCITAGVGTRSYASPEQMNGSDYDSSTDVYSLGIILFELCYPMYTGMERNIVLSSLRKNEFPEKWASDVAKSFPVLDELVQKMLSHKPLNRPTADVIAKKIKTLLGEFTIMSLDKQKYPESLILLRVEASPTKDVLGKTMQLIKDSSANVDIVQYGLRSGDGKAIMEFALSSSSLSEGNTDQQETALSIVSSMELHPDILLVRQISSGRKYSL